MADYPQGYDPIQADPNSGSYVTPGDQAIGGLIGLAAFGAVGLGAFFTASAMAAGTAFSTTVTVGGETFAGITEGQAVLLELLTAQGMTGQGAAVLVAALTDAGISVPASLIGAGTAAAFLALTSAAANEEGSMGLFFASGL